MCPTAVKSIWADQITSFTIKLVTVVSFIWKYKKERNAVCKTFEGNYLRKGSETNIILGNILKRQLQYY